MSAPEQIDTNRDGLFQISCASATFCVAVGSTGPGVVRSARMWNGTSWSAPRVIDPNGADTATSNSGLRSVSCPTASLCVAVGSDGDAVIGRGAG